MLTYELKSFIEFFLKKPFLVCALINFLQLALGKANMFSLMRLFSPNNFRGTVVCMKRLWQLCRDAEDPLPDFQLGEQKLVPQHRGRDRGYQTVIGSGLCHPWQLAVTAATLFPPLRRLSRGHFQLGCREVVGGTGL